MACPKCISMKLSKKAAKTLGRDHPDCWVVREMPHPPPHIWAHPPNWSLQLLYLHYITMLCLVIINLHIYRNEDGVALAPHWLRVPPLLTPVHAPQQQSLMATSAPAGSNAQGSGHQQWHWSLTVGHQKQEVLLCPL